MNPTGRKRVHILPDSLVLKLYNAGWNDAMLAAKFNKPQHVFVRWRRPRGLKALRKVRAADRVEMIRKLAKQRKTDREIAKAVGLTRGRVAALRIEHGIRSGVAPTQGRKVVKARARARRKAKPRAPERFTRRQDMAAVDLRLVAYGVLANGGSVEDVQRVCGVSARTAKKYEKEIPSWWKAK